MRSESSQGHVKKVSASGRLLGDLRPMDLGQRGWVKEGSLNPQQNGFTMQENASSGMGLRLGWSPRAPDTETQARLHEDRRHDRCTAGAWTRSFVKAHLGGGGAPEALSRQPPRVSVHGRIATPMRPRGLDAKGSRLIPFFLRTQTRQRQLLTRSLDTTV